MRNDCLIKFYSHFQHMTIKSRRYSICRLNHSCITFNARWFFYTQMICPCTFQSIHSNSLPRPRIISLSFRFSQFILFLFGFTQTRSSDIICFISTKHWIILHLKSALWVCIDLASCFFIIAYGPRVLKFLFRPYFISPWLNLVNTLPTKCLWEKGMLWFE